MAPVSTGNLKLRRHNPLSEDIVATGPLRAKSNKRKAKPEDGEDKFVDSRSSRKILKIGQSLVEEEQDENATIAPNPAFAFESRFAEGSDSDEDIGRDDDQAWGDEEDDVIEEIVCIQSTSKHLCFSVG